MTTHSAADSASGYLYQCRYALWAALKRQSVDPGLEVSIECFDDVSFSKDGTPMELVQTKHSINQKSVSDMSAQFWNTVGIWTKHVVDHPSDLGKIKFIFVATASVGSDGGLACLRPAIGSRDIIAACEKLDAAALASTNKKVAWATKLYLAQPSEIREQILGMIEVLDASPNVIDVRDEIALLVRRACRADHLKVFVERLEGWWFTLLIEALVTPGGMLIPVSVIDSKVDDLREEFRPEKLPIDYGATDPTKETICLLEDRPFVNQLRLVEIGPTGLDLAIVDYFRAWQQRSRWAREGLLRHNELTEYARRLRDNWARRWGRLEGKINNGMAEPQLVDLGQDLYAETTEACVPLREVAEPFITHGSYHMLADRAVIGWHPHFAKHINHQPGPPDDESPLE